MNSKSKFIRILLLIVIVAILSVFFISYFGTKTNVATSDVTFPGQQEIVDKAINWMVSEFQNDDGGYASFSGGANQGPSAISETLDVVLALAASGRDPGAKFPDQESTPLTYLRTNGEALTAYAQVDGGQAGKVVLALAASGLDPRKFEGNDYVSMITSRLDQSGAFGAADPFKHSYAILGLSAAGESIPDAAIALLESMQAADGSWDDGFGTQANADATAIAMMALLSAGRIPTNDSIKNAIAFLSSVQQPTGWEYGAGFGANVNSTAMVIQALTALGEDWYSDKSTWVKDGSTPLKAVLAFRGAAGAFQSDFGDGPFDDFYATVQAIPAVTGRSFLMSK